MNTSFILPTAAPPLSTKTILLLAEFCPVNTPDLQNHLDSQILVDRANVIATVLRDIITPCGWRHGGIND